MVKLAKALKYLFLILLNMTIIIFYVLKHCLSVYNADTLKRYFLYALKVFEGLEIAIRWPPFRRCRVV